MKRIGLTTLALVFVMCSSLHAQNTDKHKVNVDIQGELRHGVMAIGGETTGTQIEANDVIWELDLGQDEDRLEFAEKHNKKLVKVTGTLKRHTGVEIPDRWICTVSKMKLTNDSAKDQFIDVTFIGDLRTGVMAIGGETTGTTINADKITWEVDLSKDDSFADLAKTLHKKTATVKGRLKVKKGVEISKRWIITASNLDSAKNKYH